jgi:hypothetical protein
MPSNAAASSTVMESVRDRQTADVFGSRVCRMSKLGSQVVRASESDALAAVVVWFAAAAAFH